MQRFSCCCTSLSFCACEDNYVCGKSARIVFLWIVVDQCLVIVLMNTPASCEKENKVIVLSTWDRRECFHNFLNAAAKNYLGSASAPMWLWESVAGFHVQASDKTDPAQFPLLSSPFRLTHWEGGATTTTTGSMVGRREGECPNLVSVEKTQRKGKRKRCHFLHTFIRWPK